MEINDTALKATRRRTEKCRRKTHKPVLEKKRRDRINRSLLALKTLLLDIVRKNGGVQTCKLDKADILELTVNYLQEVQYQQSFVSMATTQQYLTGYHACAESVLNYFENSEEKSQVNKFYCDLINNKLVSGSPDGTYDNGVSQDKHSEFWRPW